MSQSNLNLTPDQQAIVAHNTGPALVFAVAGAGKTTSMVYRLERLVRENVFEAGHILATSFSKATVDEIKRSLSRFPHCKAVSVLTLHSVGLNLQLEAQKMGLVRLEITADTVELPRAILRRVFREARLEKRDYAERLNGLDEEDVLSYISSCKGNLQYAELKAVRLPQAALKWVTQAEAPAKMPDYLELYRDFEKLRRQGGFLTFDDMLLGAWELLHRFPELLDWARKRYRCIVVDEFQDVNLVQSELLELLSGAGRNIMVIGDDDQTIYEWRGASPRFILGFAERFHAQKYLIRENFRCQASQIVLANRVIERNALRENKRLELTQGFGGGTYLHLEPSTQSMAATLVQQVRANLERGVALSQMVVLLRVYAQSPDLEAALSSAEIPYRVVGEAPFFKRPEIAGLLDYLRLAGLEAQIKAGTPLTLEQNEEFSRAWLSVYNRPVRYLSRELAEQVREKVCLKGVLPSRAMAFFAGGLRPQLSKALLELAQIIEGLDLEQEAGEAVAALEKQLKYRAFVQSSSAFREIGEARAQMVSSFLEFAWQAQGNVSQFLELISDLERRYQSHFDEREVLSLLSIHRAKGLEWTVVFVPHCSDEIYPWSKDSPEELEAERRLLYVALTRAKLELHLLAVREAPLSRFLQEAQVDGTLKAVRLVAAALEAEQPSLIQLLALARYPLLLGLQHYFEQWWSHPHVFELSSTLERLFMHCAQHNWLEDLKLTPAARDFWHFFGGSDLTPRAEEFTGLERFLPKPEPVKVQVPQHKSSFTPKIGSNVVHDLFGAGVVMALEGSGERTIAQIAFDHAGVKRLLLKYANLEGL